jgi:CHAT domain-containing protein/tetratricopeptide (TPR) repeat protein
MTHSSRIARRLSRAIAAAAMLAAVSSNARAQPPAPKPASSAPATLRDMLREGFALYDREQRDAARQQFERALPLARAAADARAEAEAHRGIGLVLLMKAEYASARTEFERALDLYEDPADRARVEQHFGRLASALGDWRDAGEHYGLALAHYQESGDERSQARVLLALTYDPSLTVEKREQLREQAQEISVRVGDKALQAEILHQSADRDFTAGNFSSAITNLEAAIALFEELGDRQNLARALTSFGRIPRAHGHPERAEGLYRRALAIQEEVGDLEGTIQSINAIATTLDALGKHKDALAEYQRSLSFARTTGSDRLVNFAMGSLGTAYVANGEPARGVELLEAVVERETSPYLLSYRYGALGEGYVALGRYRDGLRAEDKAVELTRAQKAAPNLANRLDTRARAEQKLGESAEALADAREALAIIEQVRSRLVPTDFMKQGFSAEMQGVFTFTIELLQDSGDAAAALEAAEQARSRPFLDLLATRETMPRSIQTSQLPSESVGASRASTSIAAATMTLRGGATTAETRSPVGQLKSAESAPAFSAADAVATAHRLRSTLVMYYVAPTATFVWVVTPEAIVQSTRIDISSDHLETLVRQTRPEGAFASRGESAAGEALAGEPALATRGGDLFFYGSSRTAAWKELYRVLIRPVRHHLPRAVGSRITIIPHGPLFLLSFAALQDENGRYLLEQHAIHYAPTAALLQFTGKRPRADGAARYLLVADPADLPNERDDKPLSSLPGARREIRSIATLIPAAGRTVLTGSNAQEQEVVSRMRDATVIHFATHGIIRDDDPFGSFLALGRSRSGGPDDGKLTVEKIYGMDLRADTVVLSACRTALGKISGDGIAGLTRAFFYAGAASVVATMWDVADEPTFELVPPFYRSLAGGRDKAAALRSAQLRVLAGLRAGRVKISSSGRTFTLPEDPFFWAGFVLVGEP